MADMAEMETRLDNVETLAKAALALAIIILIAQVLLAIFLFQAWQNTRAFHHSSRGDPERGLELQNTSRGVTTEATSGHRPQNPPLAVPAPTRPRHPVGRSPTEALGRAVAAYEREQVHGEADDYYNPSPMSRKPTYTVGSGLGEQTEGADYTKQRREKRFEDPQHNTNKNDAYYGRRGDKFAHRN